MRKFPNISERRACKLAGQHRSSNRYAAVPADFEAKLYARMSKLAEAHPRWGYRMIHGLLVAEGWPVNKKRIERLWRQGGHQVPPTKSKNAGQKAIGGNDNSAWSLPAVHRNHIWSYDFVAARTEDGGSLRILNVIDEFTRQALGSHIARHIGAREVTNHLARLFATHGRPKLIRADNGREFIAETVQEWLAAQEVHAVFVAPASPQQNCYIERFNGSMRRELLNGELVHSVLEARYLVDRWTETYNTHRPHRGLQGMTPDAYAKMMENERPREDPEGGD